MGGQEYSYLGKEWWLLIKLKIHLTYNPTILLMWLLSIYSREKKSYVIIKKKKAFKYDGSFASSSFQTESNPKDFQLWVAIWTMVHPYTKCCCCSRCLVAKWYPTLLDSMNCSLPGSSVHGILQARILDWVAISFSKGSSLPGIEPTSPALVGFFTTEPRRKTHTWNTTYLKSKNKLLIHTSMMLDFKRIMLSERSQIQKATYRMIIFI